MTTPVAARREAVAVSALVCAFIEWEAVKVDPPTMASELFWSLRRQVGPERAVYVWNRAMRRHRRGRWLRWMVASRSALLLFAVLFLAGMGFARLLTAVGAW